ncbi:MAG: hypothetical protein ACK4IX_06055, partial [Candidatus Sericytochromatia bacterium]
QTFETNFECDLGSAIYTESKDDEKEYAKNNDFFYVNGILTGEDDATKTAIKLQMMTGQKFKPLYNPSNLGIKGGIEDITETSYQRFSPQRLDAITLKTAMAFLDSLSNGKGVKIVCHSQGAAITSNALEFCKKYLTESLGKEKANELMNKIEVVSFGGAADIAKFPKEVKVFRIANNNDPIPNVVGAKPFINSNESKTQTLKESLRTTNLSGAMENASRAIAGIVDLNVSLQDIKSLEIPRNNHLIDPKSHLIDTSYLENQMSCNVLKNFTKGPFRKYEKK